MKQETVQFSILGIMLFFAVLLQVSGITLFDIAPNFVMVVVVMAALFLREFWHAFFLLSVASFLLKFSPGVEWEIIIFFFAGLAIIAGERKLPWHTLVNGIFLTTCATMILYIFVDRAAVSSLMFAIELGYNVLLTYLLYHGLSLFRAFQYR